MKNETINHTVTRSMKIGLVTPVWPGGDDANGITTTVQHLVEGLEELGHEVTIIPIYGDETDDDRVTLLPPARKKTLIERMLAKLSLANPYRDILIERIAAAASGAIRSAGLEILVMEETDGWAADVQQALPIPVIVTLHGPWFIQTELQFGKVDPADKRRERLEAIAFRQCAAIASPSLHVLEKTRAKVTDLTQLQTVIPNPIGPKPAVNYAELDDKQQRAILFVGRYDHRKGADVVLQAFADLIERGADVTLTFIGPDQGIRQADGRIWHMEDALSQLRPEVRERITFLGLRTKAEIDDQRRRHFLTVVTSRYETFGYVVLEALASGSATISTAAGGPTEIIRDGETGILIPVDDADALVKSCLDLLADPARAAAMGQAARKDVAERFLPITVAGQMAEFCQAVISQHRSL